MQKGLIVLGNQLRQEDQMLHGLLPDSKVIGTAGRVRHMSHGKRHGGRKPKGMFAVLVTYAEDVQKENARKARAQKRRTK